MHPLAPLRISLFAFSLLTFACSSKSGSIPEQLEAVEIAPKGSDPGAIATSGGLKVAGNGRDFTLSIAPPGQQVLDLSVHSSTGCDLTSLDGLAVDAKVSSETLSGLRNVVLSDQAGVAYAAQGVSTPDLATSPEFVDAFGQGFATWGSTVGTDSDSQYDWTYTSARFTTDDGDIEILPGNVRTVKIAGATYRVGTIAAYRVERHPGANVPCGGISDLLSFEVLRVREAVEPAAMTRLANATMAHNGCM
jgi:hypothetical protein